MTRLPLITCLLCSLLFTQGCAVFVVGAGAVAAKSAGDRRTVGTQIDDTTAKTTIGLRWSKDKSLPDSANLHAHVYNGVALLTGQAPDQETIKKAQEIALAVTHITKVHNQIRVGTSINASAQANDLWIDSKVKAKLIANEDVPAIQIKVVVEDSEVFLMGRLSNLEATRAVEVTRNVKGVTRVVRALELIDP